MIESLHDLLDCLFLALDEIDATDEPRRKLAWSLIAEVLPQWQAVVALPQEWYA